MIWIQAQANEFLVIHRDVERETNSNFTGQRFMHHTAAPAYFDASSNSKSSSDSQAVDPMQLGAHLLSFNETQVSFNYLFSYPILMLSPHCSSVQLSTFHQHGISPSKLFFSATQSSPKPNQQRSWFSSIWALPDGWGRRRWTKSTAFQELKRSCKLYENFWLTFFFLFFIPLRIDGNCFEFLVSTLLYNLSSILKQNKNWRKCKFEVVFYWKFSLLITKVSTISSSKGESAVLI